MSPNLAHVSALCAQIDDPGALVHVLADITVQSSVRRTPASVLPTSTVSATRLVTSTASTSVASRLRGGHASRSKQQGIVGKRAIHRVSEEDQKEEEWTPLQMWARLEERSSDASS